MDTALSHARALPSRRAAIGLHQHQRRGFNLVEAAIVLAVVGLVIGGIWTAASATAERLKQKQHLDGVALMAESVINLYKGQPISANATITNEMISAGIIPANFIMDGTAKNPWGGTVSIKTGIGLVPEGHIEIVTRGVTYGGCVSLLSRLSLYAGSDRSKIWKFMIQDQSMSQPVTDLVPPLSIQSIQDNCYSTTTSRIWILLRIAR